MSSVPHFALTHCASAAQRPVVSQVRVTERARVSKAALELHVCAVVTSIYEQRPAAVSFAYLAHIPRDTDVLVRELCTRRLWSPGDDGYTIAEAEVLRIATVIHDELNGRMPDH